MKEFFLKLWPRVLFPNKRAEMKQNLNLISVQQRLATSDLTPVSIDPYAFIRVKDEKRTLLASLNSILPVIHKGVIAYNDCTDGSDLIIKDFCKNNPGFIPFCYPHKVVGAGDRAYLEHIPFENTLAGYYNAVLELIPDGEWLIKIDADQIYFPDILKHSFSLPKDKTEYVVYSRLDLFINQQNELKFWRYVRPGDHWLIFNENLQFVNDVGFSKDGDFHAYERLQIKNKRIPYKPECSSLHFPLEKKYRSFTPDENNMVDFSEFKKTANPNEFSEEILDIKTVRKIIESFNQD